MSSIQSWINERRYEQFRETKMEINFQMDKIAYEKRNPTEQEQKYLDYLYQRLDKDWENLPTFIREKEPRPIKK